MCVGFMTHQYLWPFGPVKKWIKWSNKFCKHTQFWQIDMANPELPRKAKPWNMLWWSHPWKLCKMAWRSNTRWYWSKCMHSTSRCNMVHRLTTASIKRCQVIPQFMTKCKASGPIRMYMTSSFLVKYGENYHTCTHFFTSCNLSCVWVSSSF